MTLPLNLSGQVPSPGPLAPAMLSCQVSRGSRAPPQTLAPRTSVSRLRIRESSFLHDPPQTGHLVSATEIRPRYGGGAPVVSCHGGLGSHMRALSSSQSESLQSPHSPCGCLPWHTQSAAAGNRHGALRFEAHICIYFRLMRSWMMKV